MSYGLIMQSNFYGDIQANFKIMHFKEVKKMCCQVLLRVAKRTFGRLSGYIVGGIKETMNVARCCIIFLKLCILTFISNKFMLYSSGEYHFYIHIVIISV